MSNQLTETGTCQCIESPVGHKKNNCLEGFDRDDEYKYELMSEDKNGKPYARMYPDSESTYYETCSIRTFKRLFRIV